MINIKDKLQCQVSPNAKRYAKVTAKKMKISLSQYIDLLLSNAMDRQPPHSPDVKELNRIIDDLHAKLNKRPWHKRIFG